MAEYQHDSTIGSWYFQAVVDSTKLDRMTKNARAAHWNKPRGVRTRESADIGTTQTVDTEDTHQCLLSGVRVIRGPAQNLYPTGEADIRPGPVTFPAGGGWYGDPQLLFPTGAGLPPFTTRPIVTANAIGFEIEKTAPVQGNGIFVSSADILEDYGFLNWFGGLNWDAASGTTPDGISYNVNQLFDNRDWVRVSVARPILTSHTGQYGPSDMTIGLRFRIIFGRLGGVYDYPGLGLAGTTPIPRGYYIHWMAMGPVPAY